MQSTAKGVILNCPSIAMPRLALSNAMRIHPLSGMEITKRTSSCTGFIGSETVISSSGKDKLKTYGCYTPITVGEGKCLNPAKETSAPLQSKRDES